MISFEKIKERFREVFDDMQATVLSEVLVDTIYKTQKELVKASDFNELKEIVKDIGIKVGELVEEHKIIAIAHRSLEEVVKELVNAQKRTEEEIRRLTVELTNTRKQLGGIQRNVSYALENEAYRVLPAYLKEHYGIEIIERIVRKDIKGEEIDVFGRGRRGRVDIVIMGEATLRVEGSKKLRDVLRKLERVKGDFKEEIVPIIITHYATSKALEYAKSRGIIVVQSFEW